MGEYLHYAYENNEESSVKKTKVSINIFVQILKILAKLIKKKF